MRPFANAEDSPLIRRAAELRITDLRDQFAGRFLANVIDNFRPADICQKCADMIRNHPLVDGYGLDDRVKRFGLSFYDTAKDPVPFKRYFAQAIPAMRAMRQIWHPFLSPIDQLRLELDEIWPGGANIAVLGGNKMTAGAARIINTGVLPHVDNRGFDAAIPDAPPLDAQLTANLYLQVPLAGGELALWDRRILTAEEEKPFRLASSPYGLDEAKLGPPRVVLRPQVGQLIVFDATRVHAVWPSDGGNRVTMCLFIGLGHDDKLYLL
jgi:hypothetical protein